MDVVSKLTKEVTQLKNDNILLKQELKNLHSLIEASPRPLSQQIPTEQRILLAEMSHKDAPSIRHKPTVALSTHALPAVPIPGATTLTELSYRDVAAAGISPSGPTAIPDSDGSITYRKKTVTNTPPAEIVAVNKV
jgi:hypothetical protein